MIPRWLQKPNPDIFLSNNYVVLDFETTNINKGSPREPANRIVLACWSLGSGHPRYQEGGNNSYFKFGGEFSQERLVEDIEQADFIIAQNTKFELQWLTRCGLQLQKVLPYDTIIGKYVEDGNRVSSRDLSSIASHYGFESKFSIVDKLIKGGLCPSEIPASLLLRYCFKDVELTHKIFLKQRKLLKEKGLLPVTFTRNIFTPVLSDIELNGLFLDEAMVQSFYLDFVKQQLEVQQELDSLAKGINWGSPQQVADFVYGELGFEELKDRSGNFIRNKPSKQFPQGVPKVDADTLATLKATNKKQKLFIELKAKYSKLSKSISTYLTLFKDACDNQHCYLFGNFNQTVTKTHRLSSSKPNFQNFDRTFKKLFTSRRRKDGWRIGERDAAQLEFRVAAYLGKDERAKRDIEEGFDVHSYTASIIGCERTPAKAHTFKPLFGGRSGTKAEQKYYEAFRSKYATLTKTQDEWVSEVLLSKQYVLPTGLITYYPSCKMTASGYIEENTKIRNTPIQNLATAEIIPIGATYMWHHLKDRNMNTLMINTVHDSIITDEDPEETEELNEITEHAFSVECIEYLRNIYGIDFDVPLEIEPEIHINWGYDPEVN